MAPSRTTPAGHDDLLVGTIYDDEVGLADEDEYPPTEDETPKISEVDKKGKKRKRDTAQKSRKRQKGSEPKEEEEEEHDGAENSGDVDPDFEFQLDDGMANLEEVDAWMTEGQKRSGRDIDEIVASRKEAGKSKTEHVNGGAEEGEDEAAADEEDGEDELLAEDAFGMGADLDDEGSDEESADEEQNSVDKADESEAEEEEDDEVAAPKAHPDDVAQSDSSDDEAEDAVEVERRNAFFAPESNMNGEKQPSKSTEGSFLEMSLSRPILKGLSGAGFMAPTPIQHRAIPVALMGKDVVGSAVTGSGKTAAFIIPILERLLYRSRDAATTRVAILMPTRELALQCFTVATKLASFTDVTFGQAIGGLNQREQEKSLKLRPDIVIATPGRFIDFMRNSHALVLDSIEILVLDEADRMLEDGFADELNEILTTIPKSRQTMLFSATMTSSIDNLIRVGLTRPVRLMVDNKSQTVTGLTQEFVRLRPGRETFRLGYLLSLVTTAYKTRTIIFFRQKALAHHVRIIFALFDLSAAELHGSMSQDQRISAMENFRSGKADYLLATDLASRGLDIKNVDAVINYEAPQSHEIYLHRVGRTARAGRTGRACTLAAEPDRKVVKAAVRAARTQGVLIKSRIISPDEAEKWQKRIDDLEPDIDVVLKEEKEEKVLATTEMQMRKADNLMAHEKEIMGRPKKTWFQGDKDREAAKLRGRDVLNGPAAAGADGSGEAAKKVKRKLTNKEKKKLVDRDERRDGRMWKKGKAERGGKASAKPVVKGKGKPAVKSKGKPGVAGKGGKGGGKGGKK